MTIRGKNVLVGVTGGVAAYKALEVVRLLTVSGARVQAVMTRAATELVRPESFEALTGRRAAWDLWTSDREFRPAVAFGEETKPIHIDMAQRADLFLIAPATANVIAKLAGGIADDLLTTAYLAATCPVAVAPAMNKFMWEHRATKRNVARLREDGVRIIDPDEGDLACGYRGVGRLASVETIAAVAREMLAAAGDFSGRKVLVTAGRTEEPIDPVRVITNRSSGRMGAAVAREFARRGAEVIFVAGAMDVDPPEGVRLVPARTADAMAKAVMDDGPACDAVVMAAAVGDWRMKKAAEGKMKRGGGVTLELEPTEDIIGALSMKRGSIRALVGFALETEEVEARAREKMEKKGLDLVVANRPDVPGGGIGRDETEVLILGKDGAREDVPLASKESIAARIADRVRALLEPQKP
ncbi:MAG: bifunctional phosphopantothenoylcysteine decarboxylase/phosphopantothenate--cysteine ligase CoaBC [Candidatus Eisenbacteria bacterium]